MDCFLSQRNSERLRSVIEKSYSHGGLDIGNGVLSTNTVFAVILHVHVLRGCNVVAPAEAVSRDAVVVVCVVDMEVIDVEGHVFLLFARFVAVEAVFETTRGQEKDEEDT